MTDWRIYERDIDVLLAEEFYANPDFSGWVLNRTKSFAAALAKVISVQVSLNEDQRESDLVVIFEKDDETKFAILIEDKIDAAFQPEQLEGYRSRGRQGVKAGRWLNFEVMLCAPQGYISRNSVAQKFDVSLSYEDIAQWMRENISGPRGAYKADFIVSAAPRGTTAYIKQKDDVTDLIWQEAYDLACREFPELERKKPNYASKSNYVRIHPNDFPSRIGIELKTRDGYADLTFTGLLLQHLEVVLESIRENGMLAYAVNHGKSSVIRLIFERFEIVQSEATLEKFRGAYTQSARLVKFFRRNRTLLEGLLNKV